MPDASHFLDSRILVVDDVPADTRLVEGILSAAGYTRVTTSTDPFEAAALHREQDFDLVILDLVMPGKNGYEVMAELGSAESGSPTPVLVMTADPGELSRALLAGARDFVVKPIRAIELLARVRNLLDMRHSLKALERRGDELERALGTRSAELREAESRFRALVEQSVAGIYAVEEGLWTYVNPRLCEILGYAADELVGRPKIDFLFPEDRARLQQNRGPALAGESPALSTTYRLRRKDGAMVHLSLDARYIDVGGRQVLLGVAQDVTERVLAQAQLAQAEEHYRALAEQSLMGIYIIENQRLVYANSRLRDLLGYGEEELRGLLFTDVVHRDDLPVFATIADRHLAGDAGATAIDCRVRRKDGVILHLDIESKIIDIAGRKAALGMVQDVTERKRAGDALRESEHKFRLLWETSSDATILMGDDMRIQYANPAMLSVFGWDPASVEGKDISIIQPERLRRGHREGMTRYLKTGVRTLDWRGTETVGLHRDGHEFPVEINFSRLSVDGKSVFAAFIRDITERKRAHAALESANSHLRVLSDRVLAVQEEERRLLSGELHDDVGQSLVALQLGMHRLAELSAPAEPRLLEECVEIVGHVQEKLRQVAVRLHPPQLVQLGLQEALRGLVSRQCATTGLDFRCYLDGPAQGEYPPQVEIACYRICQEALNNATRHSRARRIEVRTKVEAGRLCLSVSDDGKGFDAEGRECAGNAGHLGLIGMEERARLAGGSFELRTAPGAGTVVIAMFPRDSTVAL